MDFDLFQRLEPLYRDLQHHIDLLAEGTCKLSDVKNRSALLGIYCEKDGTYMCRIRRNSGRIPTSNLHDIADIMDAQQIDHAHVSTRQNIQLHGVPADKVYKTIQACNAADMIFRGGGGNTFRSIATSPWSGMSPSEAFDTIPHAEAIWHWVSTYERAYGFGRKFKMGLSSEPTDDINAGIQDLGFVAQRQDGGRGFKVYCGGGMGRNPGLGMVISNFIPEKEIIRVVQAAIDLFFENGNRKVRTKARLRFLLQDMGPDAFRKLFFHYLEETTAPDFQYEPIDYASQVAFLKTGIPSSSDEFEQWAKRSVKNTLHGTDIKSVRLYVRGGNFRAGQLRALAAVLDRCGVQEIRASSTQDMIIPLLHTSKLTDFYADLKRELSDVICTDGDFTGQIVSCIGATACPIGLLKTEDAATRIAHALNDLIENHPELGPNVYESIIGGIHISGCASSCGLNLISAIGFHGHKKRVDGTPVEFFQIHLGGEINETRHALACTNPEWLIEADQIETVVVALVQHYLERVQSNGTPTLQEFMASKRAALSSCPEFSIPNLIQTIEE